MNLILEVECFFESETTEMLSKLDIAVNENFDQYYIRPITFYQVDAISPMDNYCVIYSMGYPYICNSTYENIKTKIQDARNQFDCNCDC